MLKQRKRIIVSLIFLITLSIFTYTQNNWLQVSNIEIKTNKLNNDLKIIHISDLHNKEFGENNNRLINVIKSEEPDLIFITGDIIDSRRTDINVAVSFASELVKLAPNYYVSGNHEVRNDKYLEITSKLSKANVRVIDNDQENITVNDSNINIIGLSDPTYSEFNLATIDSINQNELNLLLSHRPELFDEYVKSKVDFVFSGHAHGGQMRLPILGALVAPNQGFFPIYTEGPHHRDNTTLIVSRGLGNSIIPFRVFNRPEVISLTLVANK